MPVQNIKIVAKFPKVDALVEFFESRTEALADSRFSALAVSESLHYALVDGIPIFPVIAPRNSDYLLQLETQAGNQVRKLADFQRVGVVLPTGLEAQKAVLSGLLLGSYRFGKYRSTPKQVEQVLYLADSDPGLRSSLDELLITQSAVFTARDLINTPANDLGPEEFALQTKELLKGLDLQIEIFDERKLGKLGCNAILAVGKGSSRPPRLIKISYRGNRRGKHIALVGKGITFDTGGLSLKPAESMVGMKYDMAGAAIVLGAVIAAARLKAPNRITAWLALAENMPSGSATRPNDIVRARNGKTIEILNTDAEGRLVLADALSMASEEHPDLIVDVATLTGAATIALGNRHVAAMGDTGAIESLMDAASTARELVWAMPLPDELREALNSEIADIANAKIGFRAGGMLLGGLFLKDFIGYQKSNKQEQIPWVHLDIAAVGNNSGPAYGAVPKGGTGIMTRTLIELAKAESPRATK